MMGSYYYYFEDELPPANEMNFHDCMWSGECYSCQAPRLAAAAGANPVGVTTVVTGTLASSTGAAVSAAANCETQHLHHHHHHHHQLTPAVASLVSPGSGTSSTNTTTNSSNGATNTITMQLPVPPTQVIQRAIPSNRQQRVSCQSSRRAASHQGGDVKPTSSASSGSGSSQKKSGSSSSADNKKLRHREVEKNRHRQLQAMVKTLSEKIPGRMDKETQVQTMKRAARYCIYLRDVLKTMSSQQSTAAGNSSATRERLEKIYVKSCDNVERMIS